MKIAVWAVFPSSNSWRGEGITQTLENILKSSNKSVYFELCVAPWHAESVRDVFENVTNVSIRVVGIQLSKTKKYDIDLLIDSDAKLSKIAYIIFNNKFARLVNLVFDLLYNKIFTYLYQSRITKKVDAVYFPTPFMNVKSKIHKIYSFWDPFVFEYAHFGSSRQIALSILTKNLTQASKIVTQSQANKKYLVEVLSIDSDIIQVIPLGSPDYSEFYDSNINKLSDSNMSLVPLIKSWPEKNAYFSNSLRSAKNEYLKQMLNKSTYFRLICSVKRKDRVILVSTQSRPYKGINSFLEVINELNRRNYNTKTYVIFTTQFTDDQRQYFDRKYSWFVDRVFEMSRLSASQHAFLYQLCDLVIHPSFVEGGPTLFPGAEAASVNRPSLTNKGRHTSELVEFTDDDLEPIFCDILDIESTVSKIEVLTSDQDAICKNIDLVKKTMVNWRVVGEEYSNLFLGTKL